MAAATVRDLFVNPEPRHPEAQKPATQTPIVNSSWMPTRNFFSTSRCGHSIGEAADASGVDSKLRPVPKGQAVAHYLDPSCIGYRDREIHVGKAHVAGDSCPSLLADPGDSSLERKGAGSQGTGVGTCCSMVAERVKRPAACTDSRGEWQRQAQAAKQEHPKLCGGDGDFFVGRTVRQQAACGPAWDSSNARDAQTTVLWGTGGTGGGRRGGLTPAEFHTQVLPALSRMCKT